MCFDMRPVGPAGRLAQRLDMCDIAVNDIKIDNRAGRAEPFNDIGLQGINFRHGWRCLPRHAPSAHDH
jgi:hypothetical protein